MRNLAWAAGLFEGEGCISVAKGYTNKRGETSMYVNLSLSMTDEDIVRSFAEIIDIGTVASQNTPRQIESGRKPAWLWRVKGVQAEEVGWKLLPYLGNRRREKFMEALQEVRNREVLSA